MKKPKTATEANLIRQQAHSRADEAFLLKSFELRRPWLKAMANKIYNEPSILTVLSQMKKKPAGRK